MRAKTKKVLARYWGYVLIPVLFLGWFYFEPNPLVLGVLSSLTVLYALFRAPVPCAAITRGNEFCRHNAKGRQAQAVEACASTSSVNSSEGFFQL